MSKNSHTYTVKRSETIKTVVGPRIKCPYCHLLLDPNEVETIDRIGKCTNECCKKYFALEVSNEDSNEGDRNVQ